MKILQYNLLEGCWDKERFQRLDDWMLRNEFDVVGLNEVNDWTEEDLRKQAKKWGYNYSFLFEMYTSPYFVGVMAKSPIQLMELTEAKPFHHGLLHVYIHGIHFFITHLSPQSREVRKEEAKEIVRRARQYLDEPVVVMGDLNMLSPLDDRFYKTFNPKEEEDYEAMNVFLKGGLHDVAVDDDFQYSFPTPILTRATERRRVRIDYILVNSVMKEKDPKGHSIHEETLEKISDHYPIMCKW